MLRLTAALLLISSSAFAQTTTPAPNNSSAGTATSADSAKPENKQTEAKPPVPQTNLKDTVIPKSGGTQTPEATPTTGQNK